MLTSPDSLTTFFAGCFRPFLILAGDPFSALKPALRGDVLVETSTAEAAVTVVAGLAMPRLRFRILETNNVSSISETCGEAKEDSEELSSLTSSCLTIRFAASPAAKALIDAAKDLVCWLAWTAKFRLAFAVSRASREVFIGNSHR